MYHSHILFQMRKLRHRDLKQVFQGTHIIRDISTYKPELRPCKTENWLLVIIYWGDIIQISGAKLYNISSVYCNVCLPPQVKSPSTIIYPFYTLLHLPFPPPPSQYSPQHVHEFFPFCPPIFSQSLSLPQWPFPLPNPLTDISLLSGLSLFSC